jgi:hypothetical protein
MSNTTKKSGTQKAVHLGDGVMNAAKAEVNERAQGVVSSLVDMFFDYLDGKIKEIPDAIKRLRDDPKTKKEVAALWSEKLYEQGIIPKGYAGLPDEFLIHNFKQDGYLSGLYAGMAIAMMSLVDNGAPEELAIAVRDDMLPNMLCHSYEDCREDFLDKYEGDEKYQWLRKAKPSKPIKFEPKLPKKFTDNSENV